MSKWDILDICKSLGEGGVCVALLVPMSKKSIGCIVVCLQNKVLIAFFLLLLFLDDLPLVTTQLWNNNLSYFLFNIVCIPSYLWIK